MEQPSSSSSPPPSPSSSSPETAFISGPLETGSDASYFHTHYVPRINEAISRGDHFVIGPTPHGVDANALDYLLAYPISPSRITIFVTPLEDEMWGDRFRKLNVNMHVLQGDTNLTARDRDAAMTAASSYDILRWRTRNEARAFYGARFTEGFVTNTERNWRRRAGISEAVVVQGVEGEMEVVGEQKAKAPCLS
ncbi:hypothetical protein MW887_006708 [Aspergillus wentii]|nr:hypothetical protein MW887_006708 [Aspergillus wentii]